MSETFLIDLIAGARPNFMKVAPIIERLDHSRNSGGRLTYRLVHTGQHYDRAMSASFFEQLGNLFLKKEVLLRGRPRAAQQLPVPHLGTLIPPDVPRGTFCVELGGGGRRFADGLPASECRAGTELYV